MAKKIIYILSVIIILYVTIINKLSSTKVAFSTPLVVIACFMIIITFMSSYIIEFFNKSQRGRACFKVIKILIACALIIFTVIEAAIIIYPKSNKTTSDYILVLGAGLTNGKYPSLTLKARLDSAVEVFNMMGESKKIVVSGGKGSNEDIAEADAMKNYLLECNIPENMIVLENESRTTAENFKFSKEKIEKDSGKSIENLNIKIVTTDFHSLRSRILAEKYSYGEVNNYSSKSVWYLVPISYLRESLALVKSVIFD